MIKPGRIKKLEEINKGRKGKRMVNSVEADSRTKI